ncbi:MAG: metallophosphoesterase family protein [Phycisphaerae bacterium]|nr:metallophosphoesterase family protein [Phycisphaerae bacterium]MDD5381686.1 metallophosphoesterase family protein [Phycisphaerae bacterium]
MRIGVFADVHGNGYAFEKVLASLKKEKADLYVFCGDICGYYYYQNEIIKIMREMENLICVAGNHDAMFLRMLQDQALEDEYEELYGKSSRLLRSSINKENLEFIKGMPDQYIFEDYKVAVFHGSPWDHMNEYVYPSSCLKRFKELGYAYVILGHTHYAMDKLADDVRIINPGSCGQPRDSRDPSYAIVDLEKKTVHIKRVQYDRSLMMRDVLKHQDKNAYLAAVLER